MKVKSWLFAFLVLLLIFFCASLGVMGYLTFVQQKNIKQLSREIRRINMRADKLEATVRLQETRTVLTRQALKALTESRVTVVRAKPKKPAVKPAVPVKPKPKPVEKPKSLLPEEPKLSKLLALRRIVQRKIGGHLVVGFDIVNKRPPSRPVSGYAAVIIRGSRVGKPWIESWPPMKLTPMGRPLTYRRATPFSAQRFRRLRARFFLGDKKLTKLDILVYTRTGELNLVRSEDVAPGGE